MEKKAFGQWIESLPFSKYHAVRGRIVAECKVTGTAFSQWRRGVTLPNPLARDIIDRIAREETGRSVYTTASPTPPEEGLTPPPLKGGCPPAKG